MHRLVYVWHSLVFWGLWSVLAGATPEEIPVPHLISSDLQEVEVVYTDHHAPTVSLKAAAPPVPPAPLRPTSARVDLLPLVTDKQVFGGCQGQITHTDGQLVLHLQTPHLPRCGLLLRLPGQGTALDGLSYDTLSLRGTASGPFTLALADEMARQRESNVPLTTVSGEFDLHVPLQPAARQLDLRRLVAFVILPQAQDVRITLDTLTLERTVRPRHTVPGIGFWLWEYRQALDHPDKILQACQRQQCRRLLVQMPAPEEPAATWHAYVQLLHTAQSRGIEAFALDGYPEAIREPEVLVRKVQRLLTLTTGTRLAGVQLDVEPYLLPDFFVDETGFVRYLALIEQVREALQGQARLSVVMPFWLPAHMVGGRPVAFAVMDRADEVAVMSYRTAVDEVRTISDDILRYGDLIGRPVWLAVETVVLPVERHVVLKREARRELADAYLDQSQQRLVFEPPPATPGLIWLRVHHRTTVRPERITFAGQTRRQVRTAVETIMDSFTHPSLAGVLIHDFTGYLRLAE